jgi:hypothetical protein
MKGQSLVWILYMMITALVVFGVQFLPEIILSGSVKTYDLEFALYSERVYNDLSYTDPVLIRKLVGVVNRSELSEQKINHSLSRTFGGLIFIDDLQLFVNKDFFDDAKVLVGDRYKNVLRKSLVVTPQENRATVLSVDLVFEVEE